MACNTGQAGCKDHQKFSMTLVDVNEADVARVKSLSQKVVLPDWAAKCETTYPGCTKVWNDTVGKARGLSIVAQ